MFSAYTFYVPSKYFTVFRRTLVFINRCVLLKPTSFVSHTQPMRASLNNYSAGLPGSGIISHGIITAVHVGQYISADGAVCWVLAGLLVETA